MPEYRTLFAIDECAQLADFETLAMVYTMARSYGMRVWTFFQETGQIKTNLPDAWSTVVANCAALQVFGVNNHTMASEVATLLGDFSPDALRDLDPANLALQVASLRGFVARRPDYLLDPVFKGLFDPHPMLGRRKATKPRRPEAGR